MLWKGRVGQDNFNSVDGVEIRPGLNEVVQFFQLFDQVRDIERAIIGPVVDRSSANVSWSGLTVGGNLTVSCTVTDSLGATGSASAVMSVPSSPTYPPLTDLTFSLSGSPYIDAGKSYSHTFVATPTGGTPLSAVSANETD